MIFAAVVHVGLLSNAPVECRAESGAVRVVDSQTFDWTKGDRDFLRCDAEGFEPRDIESPQNITLLPAREVTIRQDEAAPLKVEWREDAKNGGATTLIAAREFAAAKEVKVRVAAGRDRVLRIHRKGASPVTMIVAADETAVRLPQKVTGGEIYIAPRRDSFRPVAISVAGRTIEATREHFLVPGVTPGKVPVSPVFLGGIKGRSVELEVKAGETAEAASFPVDRVGGATARVAYKLCQAEQNADLVLIGKGKAVVSAPMRDVVGCEAAYHGLAAGLYHFELRDGLSVVGHTPVFHVDENQQASVFVAPYAVHVTGTVTIGKETPANGVELGFTKTNDEAPTDWERTDSLGRFAIDLPAPGDYAVSVRQTETITHEAMHLKFETGDQHVDIDLPATSLTIRVAREDGQPLTDDVQLVIGGAAPMAGPVNGTVKLDSVPFGTYTIRVFTPNLSADAATVTVTEQSPNADVQFLLIETGGELILIAPDGSPIVGAFVYPMTGRESRPGHYSLGGIAPGIQIHATAKGFMPVCAIKANASDSLRLTMQPIGEMKGFVRIRNSKRGGHDDRYDIAPLGSNCWTGVYEYDWSKVVEGSDVRIAIPLAAGQYEFTVTTPTGKASTTFLVPGPEVAIDAP